LTGFEPFADYSSNPSAELIEVMATCPVEGWEVRTALLPVDTESVAPALESALREAQPHVVLSFGLAAGRCVLSLERVALNLLHFTIPDNQGVQRREQAVVSGGPAAYFSTLPLQKMSEALQASGIPVEISLSAGTYLCNQAFYLLMHRAQAFRLHRAGFVHLPATPQLAASVGKPIPSMSLETMVQGVKVLTSVLRDGLASEARAPSRRGDPCGRPSWSRDKPFWAGTRPAPTG
jgi:pyroglutamyl-peptidase